MCFSYCDMSSAMEKAYSSSANSHLLGVRELSIKHSLIKQYKWKHLCGLTAGVSCCNIILPYFSALKIKLCPVCNHLLSWRVIALYHIYHVFPMKKIKITGTGNPTITTHAYWMNDYVPYDQEREPCSYIQDFLTHQNYILSPYGRSIPFSLGFIDTSIRCLHHHYQLIADLLIINQVLFKAGNIYARLTVALMYPLCHSATNLSVHHTPKAGVFQKC